MKGRLSRESIYEAINRHVGEFIGEPSFGSLVLRSAVNGVGRATVVQCAVDMYHVTRQTRSRPSLYELAAYAIKAAMDGRLRRARR